MKRRTFLKGVGYTAALVAGETAAGKLTQTGNAYASAGKNPEIYSTVKEADIDRAGFDFYTDHKSRLVAAGPGDSDRKAVFEISVNPISVSDKPIQLTAAQQSGPPGFTIELNRNQVLLKKNGKEIECRITAPKGVKENTEALFKVSGQRDQETQELLLMVKVLTAAPHWKMGQSKTMVYDQPQKISVGQTIRYHLSLGNRGHLSDRFAVSVVKPESWSAKLLDEKGREISEVQVGPVSGMFQWEYPETLWLEATPGKDAEKKQNVPLTVHARSSATGFTEAFTVNAFYSDPLFSLNDLDGFDPRRHYIRPGAMTSYILHLHNQEANEQAFHLQAEALPSGWKAELPRKPVMVKATGHEEIPLKITAPARAQTGETCVFRVTARAENGNPLGSVRLQAEVTDIPKIYMLVIDSLDYNYLNLNRKGDGKGREGDWLCPNIRKQLKRGVSFTRAHCGMPAATDMNHTTIVSGATTGTLGAYWVSGYYAGLDEVGDIKIIRPNPDVLRYGPEGKRLLRIFDLVKQRYPDARSAMISNKPWVSHLHEDDDAVKWGITGSHFPIYASPPPEYVLGDPPTDSDPKDRKPIKPTEMIVNGNPLELLPQVLSGDFHLLKAAFQDIGEFIGSKPGAFPDDRWIADTACQVIREEDPEVLYVNLAATDEAGHVFGAAWDPDEWRKAKGLLFGSHWVSKYSEQARREEILDVVREADFRLGQLIDEIQNRGMLDHSLIVFTADHSMITEGYRNQGYAAIDIKDYLRSQGIIAPKHYGTAWALNHWAAIFDARDDATREEIRRLIQGMAVNDPAEGPDFHPCIVLGDEGMKTGIDADNPFLPEKEKQITEPDELYSEYYIHHAIDSIRWPEISIFFRHHYQAATPGDAMIRGVNGMGEAVSLLPKSSLRLVGIHGSRLTTHVPLVFSGPGVRTGQKIKSTARLHDILPTLCHLLGWEIPETAAGEIRKEIIEV
ncbi:MAG: alkaline phosphatase family protein [Desulfobacterales bacterium]